MVWRTLAKIGWRKLCLLIALLGFVAVNAVAFMQARSMTHYVAAGQRTVPIEAMSVAQKLEAIAAGVTVPKPQNDHTPADIGLQYQTRRITINSNEWIEAWYVPHEQPLAIILMFPGYAECKESLLAPASAFHDMGYALLLVDYRGTGGSSGSDTTLGVREGTDVALATTYAQSTWPDQRVVLYGVSMGGAAILRAISHDGVQPDGIILESPFDKLLSTVGNRFHAMGLPSFPTAELLVFWGSVQQGFNGFTHNPLDYAHSVKCLTPLMHGDHDPRVTSREVHAIFDQLAGQKQFVSFAGAGHESLIDNNTKLWKATVETFLTKLDAHK